MLTVFHGLHLLNLLYYIALVGICSHLITEYIGWPVILGILMFIISYLGFFVWLMLITEMEEQNEKDNR